jgi:glyoxylase-like metal-dependent hydrolase (beta-lactamase superfamily II)
MKILVFITLALLLSACSQEQSPTVQATDELSNDTSTDTSTDQTVDSSPAIVAAAENNWWSHQPRPEWQQFEQIHTPTPWFEVYLIRKNIYAIYEPNQFEEVISYLIVGQSAALLFDSGLGIGNIASAVKYLTKKPILVLNSHHHYDHIGGNYQFDSVIALNHEFSKARSKGLSNDRVGEFASEEWIHGSPPPLFDRATYSIQPYEFSRWVSEGQVLDLGGEVQLEVLRTPGHAPDSISLLDRKRRLLFVGDTFYPGPLYAQLAESDMDQYLDSFTKLAALAGDVDFLLTAHNYAQVEASQLQAALDAFEAISLEKAKFEAANGEREYEFDGFSVLTPDPPFGKVGEIKALDF